MSNPLEDLKTTTESYRGIYRGIVRDVNDPLELGRIKVEALPMFNGIPVENLPWSTPLFLGHRVSVPPLSSTATLMFQDSGDDIYNIYYFPFSTLPIKVKGIENLESRGDFSVLTKAAEDLAELAGVSIPSYPFSDIEYLESGIIIIKSNDPSIPSITTIHPSGSHFEISSSGAVSMRSSNSVGASISIQPDGAINIKGAVINLN